jgi:hypothetical protein
MRYYAGVRQCLRRAPPIQRGDSAKELASNFWKLVLAVAAFLGCTRDMHLRFFRSSGLTAQKAWESKLQNSF